MPSVLVRVTVASLVNGFSGVVDLAAVDVADAVDSTTVDELLTVEVD